MLIVITTSVVTAQSTVESGVKIYVASPKVAVSITSGLHVPGIELFDEGNASAVAPWQ